MPDLSPFLYTTLERTDFKDFGPRYQGKVRDVYSPSEHERLLIATDRQSAFDVMWTTIPLKGQALTQTAAWWFDHVKEVMPTHVIANPDPNVMVVKTLQMLRVEIVVRGYLSGSTETSAWVNYSHGVRDFCGNTLPEGMKKNERFAHPIITPTTKGERDELLSPSEILERGLATKEQWTEIADRALALFTRGQEIARNHGLILVDTKYEMGWDDKGTLTLADEVHTPDSSRYWVADSYEERSSKGEEPESLDKEFFRLWLRKAGFVDGGPKPAITDDVRLELAQRYINLYERVTGQTFAIPEDPNITGRIEKNVKKYF